MTVQKKDVATETAKLKPDEVAVKSKPPVGPMSKGTSGLIAIITLVANLVVTMAVVSTSIGRDKERLDSIEKQFEQLLVRERMYRPYSDFVGKDEWSRFSDEVLRRLDRMERKIDAK